MLQVCQFQNQVAKHQTLSRSSSEPSQPTFQSPRTPNRCHAEENTPEHDETDTDCHTDTNDDTETQDRTTAKVTHRATRRDSFIKDKTQTSQGQEEHVENEANSQSLEGKETDKSKDTDVEPAEREEESADMFRYVACMPVVSSDLYITPLYFTVAPAF